MPQTFPSVMPLCLQHNFVQILLTVHSVRKTVRTYFYLDRIVHLWAAWNLFCSCTQSCQWCSYRSVRNRRCEAHTRQYLWETGDSRTSLLLHNSTKQLEYVSVMLLSGVFSGLGSLTFACFSIWLQCEADGAAAAHACGCVFTSAVTPPIVHCTGLWKYSIQCECIWKILDPPQNRILNFWASNSQNTWTVEMI